MASSYLYKKRSAGETISPLDEEDEEDSETELHDSEEFRKLMSGRDPTPLQRARHEEENHAVYRDWCDICVAAKGTGTQHRRKLKQVANEEELGPRIFSDYFFMSSADGSAPMLALKFSRSKRIAATSLPRKGVTEFATKFFARFVQLTGVRRFINFSDNENAMVALKDAAARSLVGVESSNQEVPVGDHQKNGEIESAVRELKRMMRALRLALERRLGFKLSDADPVLAWMATFAGMAMATHRKGKDGKTPWEREFARKGKNHGLEFGERIRIKEARERIGRARRDWEPQLIEVRYVGHHARSGSVMGLTEDGVKFGSGVKRLASGERWLKEGWDKLRGLPWDLKPAARELPMSAVDEAAPAVVVVPVQANPLTVCLIRRVASTFRRTLDPSWSRWQT